MLNDGCDAQFSVSFYLVRKGDGFGVGDKNKDRVTELHTGLVNSGGNLVMMARVKAWGRPTAERR